MPFPLLGWALAGLAGYGVYKLVASPKPAGPTSGGYPLPVSKSTNDPLAVVMRDEGYAQGLADAIAGNTATTPEAMAARNPYAADHQKYARRLSDGKLMPTHLVPVSEWTSGTYQIDPSNGALAQALRLNDLRWSAWISGYNSAIWGVPKDALASHFVEFAIWPDS